MPGWQALQGFWASQLLLRLPPPPLLLLLLLGTEPAVCVET
jgi:hypothetical protein